MPIYKVEIKPMSYIFTVEADIPINAMIKAEEMLENGGEYEDGESETKVIEEFNQFII